MDNVAVAGRHSMMRRAKTTASSSGPVNPMGVPLASARLSVEAAASSTASEGSRGEIPLSFLKSGEVATIVKVHGRGDVHHHLETLGFVEGVQVAVLSEAAGDLIVEVKGTQVALDRQVAARIMANLSA
ncbi:Fe2+ transport system [Eggerthella sp. YY7918]|nr:Fe2+ transport system [Eggerthella sp. YY7918]